MFPYFFPADKSLRRWRWDSHCWPWCRIPLNVSQVHKEHFTLFCSNVVLGAAEMAQLVKCLQSSARTRLLSPEQPGKETEPMSSHANLVGGAPGRAWGAAQGIELWALPAMCVNVHTPSPRAPMRTEEIICCWDQCSSLLMPASL